MKKQKPLKWYLIVNNQIKSVLVLAQSSSYNAKQHTDADIAMSLFFDTEQDMIESIDKYKSLDYSITGSRKYI